ncbi:CLUMA_CG002235, isoform A [Clunio marinus]|uniref:CLUMA_CG002235, isoform A n=1 Tax=Clunio marinus TaxID=568069 RepID=A0A1J1HKF0_9DIPT|nr:CLUMA_CG002235, isoform A [Clunio marinus]
MTKLSNFLCIFVIIYVIFTITVVNGGSGETVSPNCFTGQSAPCETVECSPGTTKLVLGIGCCCTGAP